jgi:hypothetical protein
LVRRGAYSASSRREHPATLTSAVNLAVSLCYQGKYAQAERIEREVLGTRRRILGEEHPDTLQSADNLAWSLSRQGKYADAERISREVLGARRRVLGEEHPHTLACAGNLAASLSRQGKHAEAERINREVLGVERRYSARGTTTQQHCRRDGVRSASMRKMCPKYLSTLE